MRGLENQVIVVTGAGSGIGRATARRFSDEGAIIAVNDLDGDAAAETVDMLEKQGGRAIAVPADVTDLDGVRSMVDSILDDFGRIDVLVNNAGWDQLELFVDQDSEVWEKLIQINFLGQVNCSRAVAEHFIERGSGGKIVNISSDAARSGMTGEAVYTGTKGAVISFTKSLARELARYDVNCNVIAPGLTDTPLVERNLEGAEIAPQLIEGAEEHIPLGRRASPDDIASAIAFLASGDADYITGQVLSANGGASMA